MKALRDEIRLRRDADGFNFICAADFIRALRGFHREQGERFYKKIIQASALLFLFYGAIIIPINRNLSNKLGVRSVGSASHLFRFALREN